MCRNELFESSTSSLARKMIGSMSVKCPNENCQAFTTRSELKSHLRLCEFRTFECPICGKYKAQRNDYVKHLTEIHPDQLIKLVEEKYGEESKDKKEELGENKRQIKDPLEIRTNANKRTSRIGSSGKYYCGGRITKCACCNGFCWPTNGCNCAACMQLDIESRCLPKGCYVNREGAICRMSDGSMHCGRKIGDVSFRWDGYCGPTNGPNCKACRILQ